MTSGLKDDTADVAESFVTTFYHDSGDEMSTDEGHGDIFELYNNSRPLTPLEHTDSEGTAADRAHNSDDPSDQIESVKQTTKTIHEKNQRFKIDTSKLEPSVEPNVEERNVVPSSPNKLVSENEATLKKSAEESTPPEDD